MPSHWENAMSSSDAAGNVCCVDRPGSIIMGLETKAPPEELPRIVPRKWEELGAALEQISGRVGDSFFGVFPAADQVRRGAGRFTYIVGVAVSDEGQAPDGFVRVRVQPGSFARGRIRGDQTAIFETYHRVHEWVRENGREIDPERIGFEHFAPARQDALAFAHGAQWFDYDIYLPLKPESDSR
ncbi:MAG: GyrI-like domain-containing protein [Phycisphaerales bacterium]